MPEMNPRTRALPPLRGADLRDFRTAIAIAAMSGESRATVCELVASAYRYLESGRPALAQALLAFSADLVATIDESHATA